MTELLREQELGALAVISRHGFPAASTMRCTSDGLTVYIHAYTYTRTYKAAQRNQRVAYTLAHLPLEGRSRHSPLCMIQLTGLLSKRTDIKRDSTTSYDAEGTQTTLQRHVDGQAEDHLSTTGVDSPTRWRSGSPP